jgi:hypothetical protein
MPKKLTFEYVYEYIKEKGYTLLSTTYNTSKDDLEIKCKICDKIYTQRFDRFQQGCYHPYCEATVDVDRYTRFGGYKTPVKLVPIECKLCKKQFQPKYSNAKLCSRECADNLWRTDEYKENAKKNGQKGGKISAKSQSKRSKNEIYFAELCQLHFDITTNEQFFDGWDADVIIHSNKTAIMWNGVWHYRQISKTQSLKQVETRDTIKISIIEKYGYTPYIIKDMGKYNKTFVEQEFELFMLMRMTN